MSEAEKIVKKYYIKLKENKDIFSEIYLFGSQIKGKPDQWSDIDVALVMDIKNITDDIRLFAWRARRSIDLRIEPHLFSKNDFHNKANIIASEIRKSGKRII